MINVSSAEVPDAKVLKMIKRAEVTLETGDWLRKGLQPNKEQRIKKDRCAENHPRPRSAHVCMQTQPKQ